MPEVTSLRLKRKCVPIPCFVLQENKKPRTSQKICNLRKTGRGGGEGIG